MAGAGVLQRYGGVADLSASAKYLAVGGTRSAPRQLASDNRWVGGEKAEIDNRLVSSCSQGTESGKIAELNFHFRFLERIEGLEDYAPHLRGLDVSSNNLRQIEGLQGMGKLKELKLYGCQIGRIQGLDQCTALAALHLEDNLITAVEGVGHLRTLEYLNLDKNRLTSIGRGLARLSKLRELHLSQNQLQSLEGIEGLSGLEVLSASKNQLREVNAAHLKGLGKLDELRLSGNQLMSLSFLGPASTSSSLPSLGTLDVSQNALTTEALKRVPHLWQLTELNLAENHIEELPAGIVSSCSVLEILDISRNRVEQVEGLARLKDLASLRELLIEGNPIARDAEARRRIIRPLVSLEYFDDQQLPPRPEEGEEEEEAEEAEGATFALTVPLALGDGAPAQASRPGSSKLASSRPSTGSSRPGTAQSMQAAGIKDPLMHLRIKVSDRKCATEEQATQWEQQTMSSLASIEAQIMRTVKQTETDLADMDRFLQKAQRVIAKTKELKAKGLLKSTLETMPEGSEGDADGDAEDGDSDGSSPPSGGARRRLRRAVDLDRDADGFLAGAGAPGRRHPASPSRAAPPSPGTAHATLLASCDEEIEDDASAAEASPDGEDEEDSPPPEVEEEIVAAADAGAGRPPAHAPAAKRRGAAPRAASGGYGPRRSGSRGRASLSPAGIRA